MKAPLLLAFVLLLTSFVSAPVEAAEANYDRDRHEHRSDRPSWFARVICRIRGNCERQPPRERPRRPDRGPQTVPELDGSTMGIGLGLAVSLVLLRRERKRR